MKMRHQINRLNGIFAASACCALTFAGCGGNNDTNESQPTGPKNSINEGGSGSNGSGNASGLGGTGGGSGTGGGTGGSGDFSGSGNTGGDTGGNNGGGTGGNSETGGTAGAGNTGGQGGREHDSVGTTWTIMMYEAADNNLESFMVNDVEEAMRVGSNDNLNIVILFDRAPGEYTGPVGNLSDFVGAKKLVVTPNKTLTVAENLGSANSGDPAVLSEFIAWAAEEYPADRYGIIISNHGGAFLGIAWDDSANKANLNLPRLVKGLKDGMQAAGIAEFNFIGFDACLMASYEVATALAPLGEYYLASEEVEPGHGWDYGALRVLADNGATTPFDLGVAMLLGYIDQAEEYGQEDGITISLTDLYAVDGIEAKLKDLTDELKADLDMYGLAIATAADNAVHYGDSPMPEQALNMIDLGMFANHLSGFSLPAATKAIALDFAVSAAVLRSEAGGARRGSTGMAVYFPTREEYYHPAYDNVPGVDTWRDFLKAFYAGGTGMLEHPSFVDPSNISMWFTSPDAIFVFGSLKPDTAKNVARATATFSILAQNDAEAYAFVIGETPADVDVEGDMVSASWDYTVAFLGQDGEYDWAYVSRERTLSGEYLVAIPVAYFESTEASAELAWLSLAFDQDGNELGRMLVVQSESGAISQVQPAPGAAYLTLIVVADLYAGTWEWSVTPNAKAFDATRDAEFLVTPLLRGTDIFISLEVSDFTGARDNVILVEKVPHLCDANTQPVICSDAGSAACGFGCCPPEAPFACEANFTCYTTEEAAAADCPNQACTRCGAQACPAPAATGDCGNHDDLYCGNGTCCSADYPHFCAKTNKCYTTAFAAQNACGSTWCAECVAPLCPAPTSSGDCGSGKVYCGYGACCSADYPHFCPATGQCFSTATAAASACGGNPCTSCL